MITTRTIDVTIRLSCHGTFTGSGGRLEPDPHTAGEIAKMYWENGFGGPIDEVEVIAVNEPKAPRYSARAERSLGKKRAAMKEIWP